MWGFGAARGRQQKQPYQPKAEEIRQKRGIEPGKRVPFWELQSWRGTAASKAENAASKLMGMSLSVLSYLTGTCPQLIETNQKPEITRTQVIQSKMVNLLECREGQED